MRYPTLLLPLLSVLVAACGDVAPPARPTQTSGVVIVDGAQAYSIVYEGEADCSQEDYPCGTVRRWDRAGGDSTVLARAPGLGSIATDADAVYFVSSTGGRVNAGPSSGVPPLVSTIARVPKAGGAVTTVVSLPHDAVSLLAVRGKRAIFMLTTDGTPGESWLASAPVEGGAVSLDEKLDENLDGQSFVTALVADDDAMFWAERHGHGGFTIKTRPLAGGAPSRTLAHGQNSIVGMALDADAVWVTNAGPTPDDPTAQPSQGTVDSYAREDGRWRTVASGLSSPGAIAFDATRVVFLVTGTTSPNPGSPKGELRAVPKAGGDITTLLGSFDGSSVSADATGACASALFDAQVRCVGH